MAEVSGPNVTDKDSVLTYALMAANAYVESPLDPGWQDVKGGFNYTQDFGWQRDGLRGHVFADTTNKTVVIALKGTCKSHQMGWHISGGITNTLLTSPSCL